MTHRTRDLDVLAPAGDDQLQFGALDHAVALRWRTVAVRDTPTAAAHHAPSATFLLLTEAADGICWLRLMSATTMQQVGRPLPSLLLDLFCAYKAVIMNIRRRLYMYCIS